MQGYHRIVRSHLQIKVKWSSIGDDWFIEIMIMTGIFSCKLNPLYSTIRTKVLDVCQRLQKGWIFNKLQGTFNPSDDKGEWELPMPSDELTMYK